MDRTMKRKPLYVAFYTVGTIYEEEAKRLRASLDRFGLEHDIVGVQSRGDWYANTCMTAEFLCKSLDGHKTRPLVYVDADAVVRRYPAIFDDLDPAQHDLAAYRLPNGEQPNGTLWLSNNHKCRVVCEIYRQRVLASPKERNEQRHLDDAMCDHNGLRVVTLPVTYCYIHEITPAVPDDEIVIEHLQCSRTQTGSTLLPVREARIEDLANRGAI